MPRGNDEEEKGFAEEAVRFVNSGIREGKLERIGEEEGMEPMREGFGGVGFGDVKELGRSGGRGRVEAKAAETA